MCYLSPRSWQCRRDAYLPGGRGNWSGQSFRPEISPSVSGLLRNGVNGMREQGVVTRVIPPDVIEVSLQASEVCRRCGAPQYGRQGRHRGRGHFRGEDRGRGRDRDIDRGVVATSFVVYLLPVVFLIAGYIFGSPLAGFFSIRISGETGGIAGEVIRIEKLLTAPVVLVMSIVIEAAEDVLAVSPAKNSVPGRSWTGTPSGRRSVKRGSSTSEERPFPPASS